MRNFNIIFLLLFTLISCSEDDRNSDENQTEDLLEEGKWVLESIQTPIERLKYGVKFSRDKQIFYYDSQGRVVPTYKEIVYETKQDTLRIVDFKYEKQVIYEKGTMISLIKSIDDSRLELKVIHPEENTIILKREEK